MATSAVILPGQVEADFARKTAAAGGLLFSAAEIQAFDELARECGQPGWSPSEFKTDDDVSSATGLFILLSP
jgi:hypothetical protein